MPDMKRSLPYLLLLLCAVALQSNAAETHRASYYKNGEIHVNELGTPEGKPLTSGHWDFKPSWSKTDDMLVFFRRLKNDPDVGKWKTAICIINVDGSGFHQLTDGTHTDFNQTWTRDGENTPIWNRKNPKTGGYQVMASRIGGRGAVRAGGVGKHMGQIWRAGAGKAQKAGGSQFLGGLGALGRSRYGQMAGAAAVPIGVGAAGASMFGGQ